MVTNLPERSASRVPSHSEFANLCATARESQVSYAVAIEMPIAAFSSGDASQYS